MEAILLELLVEQCLLIKKPESAFKNEQWSAIEEKFNINLGMNLRRDTFNNKLRTWPNNYKTIKKMKDQSGFGWNEESHMGIIDESIWDAYIMSNPITKNDKGKSLKYWKELSIVVGNDFVEGAGARTATQLERDIDDGRETIVGLDNDDGVEEIGDDENFPQTPVQSMTNRMTTNLFEKSTSVMPLKKKKKIMVDIVESIGIAVKEIGAAILELKKLAANPHIREVYRALK
ncbi:L10-interacting MYB domain-containing protein-like [Amborella trichopoda]|uniref:L10-interacting MYB domain-containing protein-like n=1 Tax=Amborella trichopoda TaxID=13333 RepID=UPI0005D3A14B|nr:L10-interacting MYB domain-containing protein-like [Amborella trichopoda]|eukprot:XP_011627000.1 L10-interacting MYB domain-containing protein-like [Amborella trichopoda]